MKNKQIQSASSRIIQSAVELGQLASQEGPRLAAGGTKLASSLLKASNDTAPLVLKGIKSVEEQVPLFAGFARAYTEINAEQVMEIVDTFHQSFNCDMRCKDLSEIEKKTCEQKF